MDDFRFAFRNLKSSPWFAVVAVLSLALALAANASVFAMVNALLLRPLAVTDADRLVNVFRRHERQTWLTMSYAQYGDFAAGNHTLTGLIAFTVPGLWTSVREPGAEARATPTALVTGNYFEVLGVRPLRGRLFGEAEDRRGSTSWPAMISERLWRTRFNAGQVIGQEVLVNGKQAVIVGVMPKTFTGTFVGLRTDLWLPLQAQPDVLPGNESIDRRADPFLYAIGRLKPGVTAEQARADLAAVAARLGSAYPDTDGGHGITITETTGVLPFIRPIVTKFLGLMLAVVGVVLVVACSNLAALLLARATTRARELAVRAALGASRARLIRQLLIESLLIAGAGAALGLVLARAALSALLLTMPDIGVPVNFDLRLDLRVFAFSLVLVVASALLFGLVPALQASRVPLATVLREDAGGSRKRMRLRTALLTAQIALSVVLLTTTVLLLRGLKRAGNADLGFEPVGIALLTFDPNLLGYRGERASALYARLLERVKSMPEVTAAGIAQYAPLGSRGSTTAVAPAGGADTTSMSYNVFTPGFFSLLGVRLQRGREFREGDTRSNARVAAVNAAAARRLWPNRDPLGQHLSAHGQLWEVVGVVNDFKHGTVGESDRPAAFFPLAQMGDVLTPVLHVKTRGNAAALVAVLPRELAALDPDIPAAATLMSREVQFSLFPARLAGKIVGVCGLLALVLAIVGLHAASAYNVARRTREFGIRIAVGASARDVSRLVLRQSIFVTALGLAIGIPLALAAGTLMRSLLYGVPAADPVTHIIVAIALVLAIAIAAWAPLQRALRTSPMAVLRN